MAAAYSGSHRASRQRATRTGQRGCHRGAGWRHSPAGPDQAMTSTSHGGHAVRLRVSLMRIPCETVSTPAGPADLRQVRLARGNGPAALPWSASCAATLLLALMVISIVRW